VLVFLTYLLYKKIDIESISSIFWKIESISNRNWNPHIESYNILQKHLKKFLSLPNIIREIYSSYYSLRCIFFTPVSTTAVPNLVGYRHTYFVLLFARWQHCTM